MRFRGCEIFSKIGLAIVISVISLVSGTKAAMGHGTVNSECLIDQAKLMIPHDIPPRLSVNSNTPVLREELPEAGTLLGPMALMPDRLEDGIYIWLTDDRENLIYSARAPVLTVDMTQPNAQYLATHRGLFARANRLLSQNFHVRAGGEFRVSNGKVFSISNRTGTFGGNRANLTYGRNVLGKKGLKIENLTRLEDHSDPTYSSEEVHNTALVNAKLEIKYHNTPGYLPLKKLYSELYKQIPDASKLGRLDHGLLGKVTLEASENAINLYNKTGVFDSEVFEILSDASVVLKSIDVDGIGAGMDLLEKKNRLASIPKLVKAIDGWLISPPATPTHPHAKP